MTDEKKLIFRLVAQNEQYLKKLEQSQKAIKQFESVAGTSIQKATRQFNNLGARPIQNVQKIGRASNDSFSGIGRSAGQASIQLQQFVGQVQAGTNPLLAFSQQAADVGIVLGAPLVGAILGIASAIGISLLPSLFDSTDALKKFETAFNSVEKILKITEGRVEAVSDKFVELAKNSQALSQSQIKVALQDISEALEASKIEVLDLSKSLSPSELGGRFDRAARLIGILENKLETGKITVAEFNEEINKIFVQTEDPSSAFKETIKSISEISQKTKELIKIRDTLSSGNQGILTESEIDAQKEQLELTNKLTKARVEAENKRISNLQDSFFALSDSLRSEEELIRDSYNERLGLISEFQNRFPEMEQEANETRLKLTEDFNKKMELLEKSRVDSLKSFTEQNLSIIAEGLGKESALGKAAFAIQKAQAIPRMIAATEEAATLALTTGPFAGPVLSGAIRALGYASIGVVAGQAIASFEGGGYTGSGPRAGGMDGRGGKLAMLHPNEKVIDLQKGAANDSGWKVEVHNYGNARVNQQIDEERKIISVMVDQARNTNSPFQNAMRENTNVMPRGRR